MQGLFQRDGLEAIIDLETLVFILHLKTQTLVALGHPMVIQDIVVILIPIILGQGDKAL